MLIWSGWYLIEPVSTFSRAVFDKTLDCASTLCWPDPTVLCNVFIFPQWKIYVKRNYIKLGASIFCNKCIESLGDYFEKNECYIHLCLVIWLDHWCVLVSVSILFECISYHVMSWLFFEFLFIFKINLQELYLS